MEYSYSSSSTLIAKTSDNRRCFFCCSERLLKSESTNDSNFHQLSFRNISRYLQLLHPPGANGDGKDNKFFNLVGRMDIMPLGFCEQCSQLAMEFNEIYHTFEVTKLRLNWYLGKLQDVMATAKNENEPEPQTEIAGVNEIGTLRRDFIGRLGQITPIPRVMLCKTEVLRSNLLEKQMPSPACHTEAEDLNDQLDETESIDIDGHEVEEVKMKREIDMDKEETGSGTHHIPKSKPIKIKIKDRRTKMLKCSFCRAEFKNYNFAAEFLHRHVAHYHCDQLFPTHRLESVTEAEFQRIVGLLLFKDLINENEDTRCAYCSKIFRNSRARGMKVVHASRVKGHLIQAHYEILEEKLLRFQNNPDLHRILSECDFIGEVCECCVFLQNSSSRATHEKWHCPLTAAAVDEKQKSESRLHQKTDKSISSKFVAAKNAKLMCKSCKETFTTRTHATRHWNYYCTKGKRLPIPIVGKISCDYCSYQCTNRMGSGKSLLKKHLVRLHPEHFFLNVIDLDTVSNWKRKHFGTIVARVLFSKFNLRKGDSPSCSLCGLKYKTGKYSTVFLKVHLINNHNIELRDSLQVILKDSDVSLKNMLTSSGYSERVGESKVSVEEMDFENIESSEDGDKESRVKDK